MNYREAYGLHASNGILFNHESPRRGETFVTRKITRALCRIALGLQSTLYLGNLSALRDWGHARDYVEMQWLMLQQPTPDDYVIATGVQHSVREFVQMAAAELGMTLRFDGEGAEETATVAAVHALPGLPAPICQPGSVVVRVDPRYFRPTEVEHLLGDASKAREQLGWAPRTTLQDLVKEMVQHDLQLAQKHHLVLSAGFNAPLRHE